MRWRFNQEASLRCLASLCCDPVQAKLLTGGLYQQGPSLEGEGADRQQALSLALPSVTVTMAGVIDSVKHCYMLNRLTV